MRTLRRPDPAQRYLENLMTFLRPLVAAILGAVSILASPGVQAQYPNKVIRMVVTYPSGGAPDILARIFSEKVQLGQAVVVDNKPGAGGNIGAEIVAKAPNDGYTLLMGTVNTHSINGALYAKMPYDMVKDFAPVSLIASTPNLLVVNNNLPVKTVAEFIAYARANPDKLSFGSPGIGSSIHISGELMKTMTGIKMTHVPYKGRQFAIPDLLGGQIQLMFDNMPSSLPLVKEGKLRALGQTGPRRSPAAPDVPTIAEAGVPGFEVTSWFAIFAPAGTPKDVIARIHAESLRIYKLPEVQERLKTLGLDAVLSTPDELARVQEAEVTKWARVVKESGAKAE